MKRLTPLTSSTLLLLPLICIPFITYGFEVPRVLLFECIAVGIFIGQLFLHSLRMSIPQIIVLAIFFLLSVITVIFHPSHIVWFGNSFRLQGVFLQWMLLVWMLNSSELSLRSSVRYLPLFCLMLLLMSGFFLQDPSGRAVGLLGEANSFAGSGVLLGVFSYVALSKQSKQKLLCGVVFLCTGILVLISGSRSGLLACILSWILLFLSEKKPMSLPYVMTSGVVFLVGSLLLPLFSQTDSWENRSQIWHAALVAGVHHPLFGNGFGNITQALRAAGGQLHYPFAALFVDSSHNVFLDWWVQGGLVGVGLLLFCIGYSLWLFGKKNLWFEAIVLLVSVEIMCFNPVSVYILAVFWWAIGRGLANK